MLVSVIIPSLNSPVIDRVLDHIARQQQWQLIGEILVIGRDEPGLIGPRDKVRFFDTGERVSAPRARNMGIAQASHPLLIFLDSDCLPAPGWLSSHLQAHDRGPAVVGGGVMAVGEDYWSLGYNLSLFHEFLVNLPDGPRKYLPSLNLSVQRAVVEQVGGFDESLARGQDMEWTARVRRRGIPLYFCSAAAVRHVHGRSSLGSVWRDCARSGYYMRKIRLNNADMLTAPRWLRSRLVIILLSPVIALAVTLRLFWCNPGIVRVGWHTIPAIILTKLAWCWGAAWPGADPFGPGPLKV